MNLMQPCGLDVDQLAQLEAELVERDVQDATLEQLQECYAENALSLYEGMTDDELIDEYINRFGVLPFDTAG